MSITAERKILNLNKACIRENINIWVEQDIIVPDTKPDAIKIINVTVNAYVTDTEVMDGKIKVTGRLNYYVIYKSNDSDMGTRGLYISFPYSQILNVKEANKNMIASVRPTVRNIIYSLPNERKIATKTEVIFKVELRSTVPVNLISKFESDDEIECKEQVNKFCDITKVKKSIIASKEDIMLQHENNDFFEILKVNPTIRNLEHKESYNKIMVKGDIDINVLYLSNNKEDQVKKLKLTIPFTGMVELDNINDRSHLDIKYILQDFNLKPNTEITSTKALTADYKIEVIVKMFEENEVEYVSDFYSQTLDLDYERETVEVVNDENKIVRDINLKDSVSNILSGGNKVVEYTVDTSYIVPRVAGNTVHIEGNAKVSLIIFNQDTTSLDNKVVDILVNEEYTLDEITSLSNVDVVVYIDNSSVSQNDLDLDINLGLKVEINIENLIVLDIVSKIVEKKLDAKNLDSMNIYIVKPKDTLWSIAKKYKTSVDKIVKTNDIDDPERIDIGQKILIIR